MKSIKSEKNMKIYKVGVVLMCLVLTGCVHPKFLVTDKFDAVTEINTCKVYLWPLNRAAYKIETRCALVGCDEYNVGDTLIMTKKEFTNF